MTLITTGKEEADVKLLRLVSGEELLALVEENEGYYNVSEAVVLVRTSETSLGLIDWLPYTKKDAPIAIKDDKVLFVTNPADILLQQYQNVLTQKTTGIVTPQKPKLVV